MSKPTPGEMEIVYYILGLFFLYHALALIVILHRIFKGETMLDIHKDIEYKRWIKSRFRE